MPRLQEQAAHIPTLHSQKAYALMLLFRAFREEQREEEE